MAYIVSLICLILTAVFLFCFIRSIHRNYYRFRNILFIALMISFIYMAVSFALSGNIKFSDAMELYEAAYVFIRRGTFIMAGILAVVCVFMSVSNISLIRHEGLKPKNVAGAGLEVIFIAFTLCIYLMENYVLVPLMNSSSSDYLQDRCFRLMFFSYSLAFYLDVILAGIFVMGWLAARQHPKYDKDFIIIPGCSIRKDGGLLPLLKGRTNRAIKYAWEQEIACGKNVLFVPSGGQGPGEIISEGSAMEMYLISHSAEQDEVFAEKQSRNTYENFYFSKKIIDKINPEAKVAFATTNYHVLRCGMLAHKVGMEAEGIASDTKWYFWPNGFAREVIAIFVLTRRKHLIAVLGLLIISLIV